MRWLVCPVLVCAALVPAQQAPPVVSTLESSIVGTKSAYVLGPPELLVEGTVYRAEFSPDGRFALLMGEASVKRKALQLSDLLDPAPRPETAGKPFARVWDVASDVQSTLPEAFLEPLMTSEIRWTSDPNVLLLEPVPFAEQAKASIQKLDFRTQKLTTIVPDFDLGKDSLAVSPLKPVCVVFSSKSNNPVDGRDVKTTIDFRAYGLDGTVIVTGSGTCKGSQPYAQWTEDGQDLVFTTGSSPPTGHKLIPNYSVLNLRTKTISETAEDIKTFSREPDDEQLSFDIEPATIENGATKKVIDNLWMSCDALPNSKPVLAATDVQRNYFYDPDAHRVIFMRDDRCYARQIFTVDLASFMAAKKKAEKYLALQRAKLVAAAVLIYSSDYDDMFPTPDGISDKVMPYLKNADALDGFVYTFKGGPMSNIEDVSKTELGYITIEGGRVVAYVDGHCLFIKN